MGRVSYIANYPYGSKEYNEALEHPHAVAFMEAFRAEFFNLYAHIFHIPNGGSRNKVEAANMKMEGVKAGIHDYMLSLPNPGFHGLFLELKRVKDNSMSDAQEEFAVLKWQTGYCALEARGWMQAIDAVRWYLGRATAEEVLKNSGLNIEAQYERFCLKPSI